MPGPTGTEIASAPQPEVDPKPTLRRICFVAMGGCSALCLVLWPFSRVDLLGNALFREVILATLMMGGLSVAMDQLYKRFGDQVSIPLLKVALELAPDVLLLLVFRFWVPGAITLADYMVLEWSAPLADPWLAAAEGAIGMPHPATYAWFADHGLIRPMIWIYESIEWQIDLMFLFFLLVRRDMTPLWRYAAIISSAGAVSVLMLAALPAEGPWAFYQGQYLDPPPIPDYLVALRQIREGAPVDLNKVYGFLNFPSFHTVFALTLAWTFRRTPLFVPVLVLDLLVVVSTVPIGWHYLLDVVGGILWFAAFAAMVEWLCRRAATP